MTGQSGICFLTSSTWKSQLSLGKNNLFPSAVHYVGVGTVPQAYIENLQHSRLAWQLYPRAVQCSILLPEIILRRNNY